MKSLEEVQREQIDRLHGMLAAEKVQNGALRDAVAAKEVELREWQSLAVELGAFAEWHKDTERRNTLNCSLIIAAELLAQAKDRRALIVTLVHDKLVRPMVRECERIWPTPATTEN